MLATSLSAISEPIEFVSGAKIDLTVTISVIIALCALFAPSIQSLITSKHEKEMKQLELKQKHYENSVLHKREIFENYLKSIGNCISSHSESSYANYHEAYLIALMYASDETFSCMTKFHEYALYIEWDADELENHFNSLAKAINEQTSEWYK